MREMTLIGRRGVGKSTAAQCLGVGIAQTGKLVALIVDAGQAKTLKRDARKTNPEILSMAEAMHRGRLAQFFAIIVDDARARPDEYTEIRARAHPDAMLVIVGDEPAWRETSS